METNTNTESTRYWLAKAVADFIGPGLGDDLLAAYVAEATTHGPDSEGAHLAFATLEHTMAHVAEGTAYCGGPEC